ncbi:leukocyte antigen CD37 isoform X2 [Onychostoma macrolepis]|uniref:Tetraspanin n=1 Tax=Onychostoma macrolepis TaxID=369639 RepID=A0A7J6CIR5_9TELE|nr:leukocyte antigen CD37 isoform X2 [Onychostoma macrolepis]KAF4106485.1 hypothetical protein G5714_012475 [Onychostoma macrolepis]
MASECCLSLTKYFLFLFNLIFFLLGSLLISIGLWLLLSENRVFMPSTPVISIPLLSYLLIGSGSLAMSLGFLGCLGSLMTVKCLLATYFILLTVLLAAQIVGGVLFYTQRTELTSSVESQTIQLINSFGGNASSVKSFQTILEYIQQEAKCCGWNGIVDWNDYIPCSCYNKGNATVNATSEINDHVNDQCIKCSLNSTHSDYTCGISYQGCSKNIKVWLDNNLYIIVVVILAISVVEICGMILSMCLYKEGSVDYNTIIY